MDKAIQLFKALSDKSRLRILNSLKEGPMYVELLSQRLELAPSTISFHLKKLEECGLVSSRKEQYYVVFSLNNSLLEDRIIDLINFSDEDSNNQNKREEIYKRSVIETYFEGDKLSSIPIQKEKRRIILEQILKEFNVERKYKEKEVNILLADINDDFITLRRELVKSNFLIEDKGYYTVNFNSGVKRDTESSNLIKSIEDFLWDKEKVICIKQDGFILDIKGVPRKLIKEESIFFTNRSRILTYQTTTINGFELAKYVFSYNFSDEKAFKEDKTFIESCFDKNIFVDNRKILFNIIDEEVICNGEKLKVKQESNPYGFRATMDIRFNLSLDEFKLIRSEMDMDIFEEEVK